MRKWLTALLTAAMLLAAAPPVRAAGPDIAAPSAILMDAATGTVLYEKNASERLRPASVTKVMTLLVAAENLPDLDATFTMTQAIIDPLYLAGASMAGYVNGETVTMRDLLYGAVVPSGAEATEVLAQAAGQRFGGQARVAFQIGKPSPEDLGTGQAPEAGQRDALDALLEFGEQFDNIIIK